MEIKRKLQLSRVLYKSTGPLHVIVELYGSSFTGPVEISTPVSKWSFLWLAGLIHFRLVAKKPSSKVWGSIIRYAGMWGCAGVH